MRILIHSMKKFFIDNIEKIKKSWNDKRRYLEAYVEEKDFLQIKFDDLAPKDDVKECEEYCKSIEWGIENKKVFNIALTGPYGSGKSSILRTFEKNHLKYKYLNISLASFYEQNQDRENEEDSELDNKSMDIKIEKGILQQLFYKIDSRRIPYTRFRKIKNMRTIDIVKNIILIIITIILALFIFKPDGIGKFISSVDKLYNYINNDFIFSIIYSSFIYLIIYNIVKFSKYFKSRIKLSTLTFEKAKLEIDKQSSESIFNQYLDEILYFFEVTKYNVVVIEDLDRFNNTRIFTKLRELNQLINNYEKINRKIIFIYAVKDDMFTNDDRTKFFDFIIPVIPVINQVNSGDRLLEKVKQDDLGSAISKDFINGVSVYIEDMRMLTNIYNEYILYKSILDDISLKAEKILALVIYKNLYPTDFSKLQYNRGLVYEAFEYKKEVIKNKVNELNNEIRRLELKLECAKNDYLSNIKELKIVFLSWISGSNMQITRINNYEISEFLDDDFDIDKIFSKKNIEYDYYENRSGVYSNSISIEEIDKKSGLKYTFKERFENVKYKTKENKESLKIRIKELKNEVRKLNSLKLEKIIEQFGIKDVLKEEIIKEKPIVYLLRHGNIDETYINYLTYFYENNLTVQDMNFILGVRNYEGQAFDYELTKIDGIIYKLNEYEFEQKEILNFELLEFILRNKEKYSDQLGILMNQFSDENEVSVNFIDEFIEYISDKREEGEFWNIICTYWNRLLYYINNYCNYSKDKVDEYVFKIIKYVNINAIGKLNIDNDLVRYIENSKEFLPMVSKIEITKIQDVINKLNIKFNIIEINNVNEELLNYIWDGCFYNINKKIIQDILMVKCNEDINNINQKNFTTIKNSNYENLIMYTEENIYDYVNSVFLAIEENNNESIRYIIELLNIDVNILCEDIKLKIIHKEEFNLSDIEDIPKNLWEDVLISLKVETSWNNVLKYYNYVGKLDDALIKYLNNRNIYNQLSLSKCENSEINNKLFDAIIESKKIEINSFRELVKSIEWIYTEYDTSKISYEHMEILIEYNKFEFNVENYENIRASHNDIHIKFIEQNINEYIRNINEYVTDADDLYKILILPICNFEDKKVIISKMNEELSNGNILLSENLQRIVYEIIVAGEGEINIGSELYKGIFNNVCNQEKIKLLSNQSSFLKNEYIKESLDKMGKPFSNISLIGTREKIPYSEHVLQLASSLDDCGYISSKSIVENKAREKFVQFNQYNKNVNK